MNMRIVQLHVKETIRLIDHSAMSDLRTTLGAEVFEELFEDAVFQLTERLARIQRLMQDNDLSGAEQVARDLVAIAGHIGLSSLSAIAAALEYRCADDDLVAAQAVAARLIRVGQDSLLAAAELSVEISERARGA